MVFAAYTNHPPDMEGGFEATHYYNPPNLTYPFGSYICVVDIDRGTGQVTTRRFVAVDDCGTRINPMIVEGQIHGGLTQGFAPAMMEEMTYDENGNLYGGNFMDYMVPTAVESPKWRNPSNGDKKLFGDYLMNAQGEDVVAGIRTPISISNLAAENKAVFDQFVDIVSKLEKHYRDMQDVEFTIERGKLWMLQTRNGKSTARSAMRIAV